MQSKGIRKNLTARLIISSGVGGMEPEIPWIRGNFMALINCPECKQPVSPLAKICPHCGVPVSDMKNQMDKHDEIKVKICPRCTQTNPDSWEICSQCGFPFENSKSR